MTLSCELKTKRLYNIPLFQVFTKILKIYELPKINNKIIKKLLTIIIYQVSSMSNFIWLLNLIENKYLGQRTLLALY